MRNRHEAFIKHLVERWQLSSSYIPPVIGCNQNQIEQIKRSQAVNHLPDTYKYFMLYMGREAGGIERLWSGELRFPYVLDFKNQYSIPILTSLGFTDNTFVFMTDQDLLLLFFDLKQQEEDPIVFSVTDGTYTSLGKFSEILVDWVESSISS